MASAIENERAKSCMIYTEAVAPGLSLEMDLNKILVQTQSEFQKIGVIETYFGKTLITDGKTQSAQFDEFAYHESLVHPPMLHAIMQKASSDEDKKLDVFIGGGAELATAREVLRYKNLNKVTMVDIDGKLVDVCKEFLEEWGGQKVVDDERMNLVIGDAYDYIVNKATDKYDVIIMDISDPIEAGPGIMLYTKEFYENCATHRLKPNGVFVTQSGAADTVPAEHYLKEDGDQSNSNCYAPIKNTLKAVFDCVVSYSTNIPSFGGDWGYNMAFQNSNKEAKNDEVTENEWKTISTAQIDKLIEEHIDTTTEGTPSSWGPLKHYDGITHQTVFSLTKPLRKYLASDTRIMTKANPIFMY